MSPNWTAQTERGSRSSLRIILWIALHLGRSAARVLLPPITLYFLIKARPQRIASRLYLSRVLGRPARLADVMRHIHCFASTILDRVFFLAGQHQGLDVRLHGEQLVTERIARKQGILMIGAHLGSFEATRALGISMEGIPLKILMYPEHNQVITEMLHSLNPQVAEAIIPMGSAETMLATKESLDKGYAVGMLADRFGRGEPHVSCRFFSDRALFPAGPMTLAAATKVPVLLFFGLYRGGNRYDLHFELFAEKVELSRAQRGEDLQNWVQKYVSRLEHYARIAPYNWFNFYDFWNDLDDASP